MIPKIPCVKTLDVIWQTSLARRVWSPNQKQQPAEQWEPCTREKRITTMPTLMVVLSPQDAAAWCPVVPFLERSKCSWWTHVRMELCPCRPEENTRATVEELWTNQTVQRDASNDHWRRCLLWRARLGHARRPRPHVRGRHVRPSARLQSGRQQAPKGKHLKIQIWTLLRSSALAWSPTQSWQVEPLAFGFDNRLQQHWNLSSANALQGGSLSTSRSDPRQENLDLSVSDNSACLRADGSERISWVRDAVIFAFHYEPEKVTDTPRTLTFGVRRMCFAVLRARVW